MNLNKTLAALAVAMLASLAVPMGAAHPTPDCADGTTLGVGAPTGFPESASKTSEGEWKVEVSEGSSRTIRLAAAPGDVGLTYEVYQKVDGDCTLIQKGAVATNEAGNTAADGAIVLANAPEGTVTTDSMFFVHVFVPDEDGLPDGPLDYRIYA